MYAYNNRGRSGRRYKVAEIDNFISYIYREQTQWIIMESNDMSHFCTKNLAKNYLSSNNFWWVVAHL